MPPGDRLGGITGSCRTRAADLLPFRRYHARCASTASNKPRRHHTHAWPAKSRKYHHRSPCDARWHADRLSPATISSFFVAARPHIIATSKIMRVADFLSKGQTPRAYDMASSLLSHDDAAWLCRRRPRLRLPILLMPRPLFMMPLSRRAMRADAGRDTRRLIRRRLWHVAENSRRSHRAKEYGLYARLPMRMRMPRTSSLWHELWHHAGRRFLGSW